MPRRTIRLTADTDEQIRSVAKLRGYSNPSAFLRAAIKKELDEREDGVAGAEERLAASIEQVRQEIFRLGRAQQALFAFVDSLAKVAPGSAVETSSFGTSSINLACPRLPMYAS
jgi:Arc/MetJ-type ribon-helix-helix transcriptional regulator